MDSFLMKISFFQRVEKCVETNISNNRMSLNHHLPLEGAEVHCVEVEETKDLDSLNHSSFGCNYALAGEIRK